MNIKIKKDNKLSLIRNYKNPISKYPSYENLKRFQIKFKFQLLEANLDLAPFLKKYKITENYDTPTAVKIYYFLIGKKAFELWYNKSENHSIRIWGEMDNPNDITLVLKAIKGELD